MLRTAVIGVGHLGKQHARIHAALAQEGQSQFVGICDIDQSRGAEIANQHGVPLSSDWRELIEEDRIAACCQGLGAVANPDDDEVR